MKDNEYRVEGLDSMVQVLIWITLVITAIFVRDYMKETQDMKREMVTQNKLNWNVIKIDKMPIIDIEVDRLKPEDTGFTHDVYIVNRGDGPAFNILIRQTLDPDGSDYDRLTRTKHIPINPIHKTIGLLGKGQRVMLSHQQSKSRRKSTIKVFFRDVFKQGHTWEFEADRFSAKIKNWDVVKDKDILKLGGDPFA